MALTDIPRSRRFSEMQLASLAKYLAQADQETLSDEMRTIVKLIIAWRIIYFQDIDTYCRVILDTAQNLYRYDPNLTLNFRSRDSLISQCELIGVSNEDISDTVFYNYLSFSACLLQAKVES